MAKGTPSFGKHNKAIHTRCRRCGKYAYNKTKKKCSACGYPHPKLRNFRWSWKHPLKKNRRK